MTLRTRLLLAALAATLPTLLLLLWIDVKMQHRTAERLLYGFTTARLADLRAGCKDHPASFGGTAPPLPPGFAPPGWLPSGMGGRHAQPVVTYAYDSALRSRNPHAPLLSAALREGARQRDVVVAPYWPWSDQVELLLRTPFGEGPCAYVLAHGTTDSQWGALPATPLWLLPTCAVLAAVLLAAGPVVVRIRWLTQAVRRSASESYASAVAIRGRDEIGELALAFDKAAQEIRRQMAEKDRREQALRHFLANTTHDVMIPLTVLLGHLSTLREQQADGRSADAAVLVAAMDEAHYLGALVQNLAMAARLEAAEVQLHASAVDINALVQRVVQRHRPMARQLGVSLDSAVPAEPVVVSADVTLLEQAVSNVTYNGVRYNRRDGHVAVILERGAEDAFVLRVIDDGPGIPAEARSQIVERGARGDEARRRAPSGQGLGLHIAYRAVALHGFTMTMAPSEYGGLEVTIAGADDLKKP